MIEVDRLTIANPDIQKYLSENAGQKEEYFRDPSRLKEDLFYKAKTLTYMHINMFDEILSGANQTSGKWSPFRQAPMAELQYWKEYIFIKLHHPLYRSILRNEGEIYGRALRIFWQTNKNKLSDPSDPFVW